MYGQPGLRYRPATCPSGAECSNWDILLSDGNWHPANGNISFTTANTVDVTLANVKHGQTVKGVRYAYARWPLTTIFSYEGLPAIPFEYHFSSEETEFYLLNNNMP